jgi:glycosyltransferase involved in cell wall biosynthesis
MKSPRVSVLVSAFNEEEYIQASLDSLLSQTFPDFEVLVGDDGSTDKTLSIVQGVADPRIRCFSHANMGKAATLNVLLENARGEYCMVHDADDISKPRRIETLVESLEGAPDIALLLSGHSLILDGTEVAPRSREISPEDCRRLAENLNLPAHDPTMMVRAEVAREFRFDGSLRVGEGVDFIFRIADQHPIKVIDEVLYAYRIHASSLTHENLQSKIEYSLEALNKSRLRRGQLPWTREQFMSAHGYWAEDKHNNLSGHFSESAYQSVMKGRRREAMATALVALKYAGDGTAFLKPLMYALAPKSVGQWGRGAFGGRRSGHRARQSAP